jgi:hypothetical protein
MITLITIFMAIYIRSIFKAYKVDFNFNKLNHFWEACFGYGTILTIVLCSILILCYLP